MQPVVPPAASSPHPDPQDGLRLLTLPQQPKKNALDGHRCSSAGVRRCWLRFRMAGVRPLSCRTGAGGSFSEVIFSMKTTPQVSAGFAQTAWVVYGMSGRGALAIRRDARAAA